jgi:hypothetical protein
MTETSSQVEQSDSFLPRWRILVEIALIFMVFFIEGAWPVPDVNEPHYLGKAIHYWNPNWIEGDFFLDSKDTHVVFYLAFGWLSLWLTPITLAWTGRIITWWLLAWSWRRMSFALLPKPGWSIITAALFAMLLERFHMAGEWVVGGIEAKGFAYVLVFLGLEALVRNRWNRAWLMFGAAAAFHVLVGGWAAVAAGLAWLFTGCNRDTKGTLPFSFTRNLGQSLKTLWPGLLGGLLLALPGLLPALLLNVHTDAATTSQANQIYVFERLPHHLNLFQIYPSFIIRFALLTALYFALSWGVSYSMCNGATDQPSVGARRGFMNESNSPIKRFQSFILGAIIIALAGAAINMLIFIDRPLAAGLLRFYWFRLADVAVPLGVSILGCWWIVDSWRLRSAIQGDSPIFVADHRSAMVPEIGTVPLFAALLVGLATIYHFGDLARQRFNPSMARAERLPNVAAWQECCLWASDGRNTPPSSRFITPRMAQTFKWHATRAEVANWKDIPQDAPELVQWWSRIQNLFATRSVEAEHPWYGSLNELGEQRLVELSKKYQADYLITDTIDPPLNFKIVHKNEGYTIYQILNPDH